MDKAPQTEEKCRGCENLKGNPKLCPTCTTRHIQAKIDEFIKYTQTSAHDAELAIQWADWKEFTDIKKIGEGGFGSVYSSCWSKEIEVLRKKAGKRKKRKIIKKEREIVALKTIGNPNELMNNFLKEVIYHFFNLNLKYYNNIIVRSFILGRSLISLL